MSQDFGAGGVQKELPAPSGDAIPPEIAANEGPVEIRWHRSGRAYGEQVGLSAQPAGAPELPKTPEQAKEQVFAHWQHLDALCRRRFPKSENLAHEGLLYVLERLEADEWQRVRAWEGLGRFVTFLTTLASRLLTDFTRMKFGHIRMPTWLADKADPLWGAAYRLLIVEQYQRHEVVEILETSQPLRSRWFIEEVVTTVRARCRQNPRYAEAAVPIEHCEGQASPDSAPDKELGIQDAEIVEALRYYLDSRGHADTPATQRIGELLSRLSPHIHLTEEDRLLLRLRYVDGLRMTEIVKLCGLKGDPYKRYNKIIKGLRDACLRAGLLSS